MKDIELPVQSGQRILENLLKDPRWSSSKVAKVLGLKAEAIGKLSSGHRRLRMKEVDRLAKACGKEAYQLLFDSFDRDEMEKRAPGLYDLGLKEIDRHKKFLKTDFRGSAKKRRSATTAA